MGRASIILFTGFLSTTLFGQEQPRITRPVDESAVVRLPRTTHPLATPANDAGRVPPDLPMERILLQLMITPEQQAALERLLSDQQDPASPRYHQWLAPEQFGQQFGPVQEDLTAVTSWLESRGFTVDNVAGGRTTIEFSGSAGQVESAFHTEIHRYLVNGESHIANATDIAIPDALAPVVAGVVSLHDFPSRPLHNVAAPAGAAPRYNLPLGAHALAPYDFATIYDLLPLWNMGFDGTGQAIAIPGRTNIVPSDITTFRSTYGLPGNNTQIIVNGPNPGILGASDEAEADLDVEWSGAAAKGAAIKFVVSRSTNATDGVDLSSSYIVNNNIASVVSVSFGQCEAFLGTAENQFFGALWSQAAAQGMSVFVAAGDEGSAACDPQNRPASNGFAVSGFASTPYNVAVGGTEFNDTDSPATWWNASNDSHFASAKSYIPELVWNESSYSMFGAANLAASSGGVSAIYATPSWQTGVGVPAVDPGTTNQHHRYLPDVSLNAGSVHVGYEICQEGQFSPVGGTSAASPSMAGIMAIVNQYTGGRNGNPDPHLYALAARVPSVYHDVTSGSNAVPCRVGSPDCNQTSPFSIVGQMAGYTAGPGFDLATGWGSVDAYALAVNWAQPGIATHFAVSVPLSAGSGVPFNAIVTALDAFNNAAASYTGAVHFTSTDSAATMPANATLSAGTGTFSVVLKTAGSQTITASDAGNSSIAGTSAAISVSALPDLVITSLTAASAAIPGGQISTSVTVLNQGAGAAGQFVVEFYFSAGSAISTSSVDTGSGCTVAGLAAGASKTCTVLVGVPASLAAGIWYLGAIADPANAVVESNKNNNSRVADSGPVSVSANPPSPVSVSPGAGSGAAAVTFTFSDPNGWQNLDVVNVLINNVLDGRSACYLAYSRPSGVLYLVGDAGGGLSPGLALGASGSVSNSQCAAASAGSSASGSGNTLTLTLNLTFTASFAGNKVIYLAARDLEGGNSGWQVLGTWSVPGSTTFPAVGGVTPARGAGLAATFTFTFSDTKGYQDLGVVNVLVNDSLDGHSACYLAYSRPSGVLYLVGDDGGGLSPGLALGASGSVGNSQCSVTSAGSSASGSGNTLTLILNLTFSSSFDGNRVIYMAARDSTGANNSGWQSMGSWTVQ